MDELRVYLRDLISGEWIHYAPDAWIDQYYNRIAAAIERHGSTVGGSFALTGTPERGRMTVCDVAGDVVLDFDWQTMTVSAARRCSHP
ncbi:Uncharacterised protein [Mycobacteroides abscessus subsp. abscessus]|uniref:hypothetical protein n=1 Tax=Mycobacteroides abscessus TaxID=36809 RepID=UPI000925B777|nr:hypothetical protein [Mycobacteroides abscessus]SIL99595.1 Uncharacterised protein [Mycobacteroides abscessus subsp. abscessus]SLC79154.1 Uncharacterised protein [Mycobacteroides abscessus subsp. abscessus]